MTATSDPGGLAQLAWGEPARPVDLVFLHANGFNARTYRTLLAPLGERFHVVAPDLRGHGGTTLPTHPENRPNWDDMCCDVVDLLHQIDAPPMVLAGHSMGATVALLAAVRVPKRVRGLVLLDPVILDRAASSLMRAPGGWRLARRHPWAVAALKRRRRFADSQAAFAAYQGRGAFKAWPEEVLRDYVEAGFRPTEDGDIELTATPEWESSNYTAQANDPWGALKRVGRPVDILKAGQGSTCAVTERDAARLKSLTVETLMGGTHFFPMIQPDVARAALERGLSV